MGEDALVRVRASSRACPTHPNRGLAQERFTPASKPAVPTTPVQTMSPKKTTSKKPAASSRSKTRKETTKAVAEGAEKAKKKAAKKKKKAKKVAPKPAPLSTKPDQMPGDVLEFIQAIDDYKRVEGRPFPTWSEVLDIVKELGYERKAG